MHKKVKENINTTRRKRVSNLSRTYYNQICDTSLCHILCLAGYGHNTEMANNHECFNDVMTLLTGIKARLIRRTKLTDTLAREADPNNDSNDTIISDDELTNLPPEIDEIVQRAQQDEEANMLSSPPQQPTIVPTPANKTILIAKQQLEESLVSSLSRLKYNQTTKLVNKLNENEKEKRMQSYHKLTKTLPALHLLECRYNPNAEDAEELDNSDGEDVRNNPSPNSIESVATQEITCCQGAYVTIKDSVDAIISKIKTVVNCVQNLTMQQALAKSFIICCADGAQHDGLGKSDNGIITYSLTIGSHALMKRCAIFPSSGKWVLPHLQLRGKENVHSMRCVLQYRLKELYDVTQEVLILGTSYIYDMLDGKAVYCSTGHSHWARTNKPFLLCECERGDHADPEAICKLLEDDYYIGKIESSRQRYSQRDQVTAVREASGIGPYDYGAHKEWCSRYNSGVCHINSVTPDYKISSFRPDVFHGRSGVVKLMVKYVRKLVEGNSRNLTVFGSYLRNLKYWDSYVVDPWEANDSLQRLKGKHTKEFVQKTSEIVVLLKRLMPGSRIDDFARCMVSFQSLYNILSMVFIDEYDTAIGVLKGGSQTTQQLASTINRDSSKTDIFQAILSKYKQEAQILYDSGHKTFMTRTVRGDRETFYLHTIRNYIPHFLKLTYERHQVGVAIFSMEAFEYKNFTSKRVVLHRTNRKGNICMQSLRILQLYFKVSYHNVEEESKERERKKAKIQNNQNNNDESLTDAIELRVESV